MKHLAHLGYRYYRPRAELQGLVQCYWHIEQAEAPAGLPAEFLHPEGGSGLIFNFADPLMFNGQAYAQPCLLFGATMRTNELSLAGRVDAIGVRFHPAAAYPFFQMPLAELTAQIVDADSFALDAGWQALWDQPNATLPERIDCIEQWLLQRVQSFGVQPNPLRPALQSFASSASSLSLPGTVPQLAEFTSALSVGTRQAERWCKQWLGLSPKQWLRICRVEQARSLLKDPAQALLTDAAYAAGYYDQAHFIHEFKQVVGLTPGQYRRRLVERQRF